MITLLTYEDCVSAGLALVERLDRDRFELGDLAENVTAQYGEETFHKFAGEVGIPRKTLYEYKRVSHYYSLSARAEFVDTNITYSHMRDAMRFGDPRDSLIWLSEVSDNGWTVDEAAYQLTERLGGEHENTTPFVKQLPALLHSITHELNAVGMPTGYIIGLRVKELPGDARDWLWNEAHRDKKRETTPLKISLWRDK